MTVLHFDPVKHDRNRLGQFRKMMRALKPGDKLRMPGGVTVTRKEGAYRIHAPHAKSLNKPIDVQSHRVDEAMTKALDRSAQTPHPKTLGGMDTSAYRPVREEELAARARDHEWIHIPPEDEADLFARPTHGSPEDNSAQLEDIIDEAKGEIADIEDNPGPRDMETGAYDWKYPGDEDRYGEAQDRLEKAQAALKQIEGMDPAEFDRRSAAQDTPPPQSVGTNEPPIGRLTATAPFDYQPIGGEATKASPGTTFDVLRHFGGGWIAKGPDGRLTLIPQAEPGLNRTYPTPVFHEEFPKPPASPGTGPPQLDQLKPGESVKSGDLTFERRSDGGFRVTDVNGNEVAGGTLMPPPPKSPGTDFKPGDKVTNASSANPDYIHTVGRDRQGLADDEVPLNDLDIAKAEDLTPVPKPPASPGTGQPKGGPTEIEKLRRKPFSELTPDEMAKLIAANKLKRSEEIVSKLGDADRKRDRRRYGAQG